MKDRSTQHAGTCEALLAFKVCPPGSRPPTLCLGLPQRLGAWMALGTSGL